MKIFVICSKKFYSQIPEIKECLESKSHIVLLPNCYDDPDTEFRIKALGEKEHKRFKAKMYKQSEEIISGVDAVLVLNFDKETDSSVLKNYIGGATFLEMYDAFRLGKKIYLWNEIPEGIFQDEIIGFDPIIINADINKIV